MWIYEQGTGRLFKDDAFIGIGYSGHGEGLNSHAHEMIPSVGPIPLGLYGIGEAFTHPKKGSFVMTLFPVDHDACRRTGLLIHGDTRFLNKSASLGCVIFPKMIRVLISESTDREFFVVPEGRNE